MASVIVNLTNVEGTEAALGWAGSHTVVVDRPPGKAGGQGIGFNGAELLGLTLGGCFCNDLRYVAHEMGVALGRIAITVMIELDGAPIMATGAKLTVICETDDGISADDVIEKAKSISMAANSLRRGLEIEFVG